MVIKLPDKVVFGKVERLVAGDPPVSSTVLWLLCPTWGCYKSTAWMMQSRLQQVVAGKEKVMVAGVSSDSLRGVLNQIFIRSSMWNKNARGVGRTSMYQHIQGS